MKLLWLCNMAPGIIRGGNGLWTDHVLSGLRSQDVTIHILFPGKKVHRGMIDEKCSFLSFKAKVPYRYVPEQEILFQKEIRDFQPDVIHIWGTEYAHTLAMLTACEKLGMADRTVVNIQGLCSVIARHYTEGIPFSVQKRSTFRDWIRKDNVLQQQRKFVLRGENEVKALGIARHVIGRTEWDRACVEQINPDATYHFCNETMRDPFFKGQWAYDGCGRYTIFASSCEYPVKGFHYVLEAFCEVLKAYPEAKLMVPGRSFLGNGLIQKLRRNSYQKYMIKLVEKYGLKEKVRFLGSLRAEQMRDVFLNANVFVLPSTIENSPNSLGEAMLLGVPCVASDVGGVSSMMVHNSEGYIYQSTAPYMLAYYIKKIFAMEEGAAELGLAARKHALKTHDPETNLNRLMEIYRELAGNHEGGRSCSENR